jgi:hypothetical protein
MKYLTKAKELYDALAGKISTGLVSGLGMLVASGYAIASNRLDYQIIVPILALFGEATYSVPRTIDGISEIHDNKKGKKQWDDASF